MTDRAVNWRACIEATIAGDAPARIPAIFRMSRWFRPNMNAGTLPEPVAGMSKAQVEDDLGLARSARHAKVYRIEYRSPVECTVTRDGPRVITEYRTASRTLRRVAEFAPGDEEAGLDASFTEFPIRAPEDYAAFAQIMQHIEFVPTYDEYRAYDAAIGDTGLPMVVIGGIPFHYMLQEWTGYERGYLDLHDMPDTVLSAVEAGNKAYRRMWDVVAESPAKLVLHGINFDIQTTPPPVFREHFLPYLKEFVQVMHQAGKKVAFHADGNMTGLLELMLEVDFDVADCFACAPLVACTAQQAREVWKDRITIWGALPSTLLEPSIPLDDLRAYLANLYRVMAPGRRFMLGLTDMAMPTTSWEHLLVVRDWIREQNDYPIDV